MTESARIQRSSRDPAEMQQRLERWLTTTLGPGASPAISEFAGTETTGMSSDTILFRATWAAADGAHDEQLVARVAPADVDVPVFPSYDMQSQFDVIRIVDDLTEVPVPRVWWCENSPEPLGAQFFVMSRVEGLVPPDNLPYALGGNWLYDATPEQQQRLQTTTIEAIAQLHDISDPEQRFPFLEPSTSGDTPLRRHVAKTWNWYDMAKQDGAPSPLVERGFDWLEANWPAHEGPSVLSWGDSRVGNVLYQDFAPVALLDWEMAGLGPAELDICWSTYAHHVFNSFAQWAGRPGMPDFMQITDVAAQYEKLRGQALRDLRFYFVYCAVQWGCVFLRTGLRSAHFGEIEMPDTPENLIHNKPHLESLLIELDGI
jgi:aminoglycoside phosphotransferase (APT) family kinase protein